MVSPVAGGPTACAAVLDGRAALRAAIVFAVGGGVDSSRAVCASAISSRTPVCAEEELCLARRTRCLFARSIHVLGTHLLRPAQILVVERHITHRPAVLELSCQELARVVHLPHGWAWDVSKAMHMQGRGGRVGATGNCPAQYSNQGCRAWRGLDWTYLRYAARVPNAISIQHLEPLAHAVPFC